MPRAAPGDNAKGAMRRTLTGYKRVPAHETRRCCASHSYWLEMEKTVHRSASSLKKWCTFTLQNSAFEVGRGRLGEVVSLVGDCRPPPPGNPHRPTIRYDHSYKIWGDLRVQSRCKVGDRFLTTQNTINGELTILNRMRSSLYSNHNSSNLKKCRKIEYFKVNRSFISCTVKYPVLEFCQLYSHLCGSMEVEPPPIAITNVLES